VIQETLLIDVIGWTGAILVLAAYALVSTGKVTGKSMAYQLPNLVGGTCLIANAGYHGAFPSVSVNAVWVCIAVVAIARAWMRRE